MKRLFAAVTFLLLASPALADSVTVKVDGMVCAFCATGLEELFTDEPGVEKVHVDLDASQVHLSTADKGPDDARIKALVEKAGFTTSGIERQ